MKALKPLLSPDNIFLHDVKDWFSHKRSGHMIRHYYSGKALTYWEAFTRFSPDYYLFDEEAKLIQENSAYLAKRYRQSDKLAVVELGTGSIKSAEQKTLPFVKAFQPDLYIATDWSEESASIVSAVIEREIGIKNDIRIADFNNDNLLLPDREKIFIQFGSTISNIESVPGDPLPFDMLVKNLKNYKNNMGFDDILIMGLDQNNDSESLIKSYSHPSHAAFSESLLYEIKEQLPVSRHFNPADFYYEPIWVEENYQLIHALIAKKSGGFSLDGDYYAFEEGDIFSYDNSFKYPQEVLNDAAKQAGLSIVETIRKNRVSLQVLK